MHVRLLSNGVETFVSPFVGRFAANVCLAVVHSLKEATPTRVIRFELEGKQVRLEVDDRPVSLDSNQSFAHTLVRGTLHGLIQDLKGIDPNGKIVIEIYVEAGSGKTQVQVPGVG